MHSFQADNVAREVIENGAEIKPAPTDDLDVGEVSLPTLVDTARLVFELTARLDHHKGRAGDSGHGA